MKTLKEIFLSDLHELTEVLEKHVGTLQDEHGGDIPYYLPLPFLYPAWRVITSEGEVAHPWEKAASQSLHDADRDKAFEEHQRHAGQELENYCDTFGLPHRVQFTLTASRPRPFQITYSVIPHAEQLLKLIERVKSEFPDNAHGTVTRPAILDNDLGD